VCAEHLEPQRAPLDEPTPQGILFAHLLFVCISLVLVALVVLVVNSESILFAQLLFVCISLVLVAPVVLVVLVVLVAFVALVFSLFCSCPSRYGEWCAEHLEPHCASIDEPTPQKADLGAGVRSMMTRAVAENQVCSLFFFLFFLFLFLFFLFLFFVFFVFFFSSSFLSSACSLLALTDPRMSCREGGSAAVHG